MIDAHIEYQGEYSYEHLMEYVQAAIHNGIDEITILQPTHKFKECSLLYREICASYPCQKEWYDRIEKTSIGSYQAFIKDMKKQEFPIKINFGLHVCYFTQHEHFISQMLNAFPYDVKVGSIQFVDDLAFGWKESNKMLWNKYNADFLHRRYYEMMNAMLTSNLFDGISGFDNIRTAGVMPKFSRTHTYQKLAKLLMQNQIYVEDDTMLHPDFCSLCTHYRVVLKPVSRSKKPDDLGKENY